MSILVLSTVCSSSLCGTKPCVFGTEGCSVEHFLPKELMEREMLESLLYHLEQQPQRIEVGPVNGEDEDGFIESIACVGAKLIRHLLESDYIQE